jgi:DHA2 family multidrug resistance protein
MLIAGRLTGKIDARLLVGLGVALMGLSLWMMTGFALDQPSGPVIWSGVVQGLGLGMIFVPLQSLAFETLAPRLRTTAASLLNLSRNLGGSIGISIVSSQLVRMTQVAHADLATSVSADVPASAVSLLQSFGVPGGAALALIDAEVTRQAVFIAYLDDFKLMMIVTFAALPMLLLMRRAGGPRGKPAPAVID